MKKLKIGLAGLGIVGKGVYDILVKDQELINKKSANKLELVQVSARNKKDFVDYNEVDFVEDALKMAQDDQIDIIVEVIGGEDIAYQICKTALENGKKVVTANKALLANRGFELIKLAEKTGGYIAFEASVGGAMPVVKSFKESFAANQISEFYAILNGTCNFILTKMKNENIDFADALKQAQDLGYAEADPTFDIEGVDTGHKLALLAAIASQSKPNFTDLYVEGITKIDIDDILLADELGYKIKLLAIYKNDGTFQAVYPAFISREQKIADIDDSFNAVYSKNSNAQDSMIVGRGAGGLPTASAIVADLIDIACDRFSFEFGVKSEDLRESKIDKISKRFGKNFIKLNLDKHNAKNALNADFIQQIKVEKSIFLEKEDQILCGLITGDIYEADLIKILQQIDKNIVKNAKFIRLEI